MSGLVSRLARCRRGNAAVEAAFVLPLLLLMLLGFIELGRLAWTKSALDFAVQEAARCAAIARTPTDRCGDAAKTQQFAAVKVAPVGVPAAAFTVTLGQPCGVRVSASYLYRFLTVRMVAEALGGAPTLRASVCRT